MRRCLGPQVLELLRRVLAAEFLVTVQVRRFKSKNENECRIEFQALLTEDGMDLQLAKNWPYMLER